MFEATVYLARKTFEAIGEMFEGRSHTLLCCHRNKQALT